VQYTFENQDITSLQNGSGLKDFTISLWLKSNKTGNVTLSVEGSGYSYSTYVTIDTASTWEYKTVTFPATNLAVGIDYTGDPTGGNFNFKVGLGSNGSWVVDTDDQWNDKTSNRGVLSSQQTNFQAAVNDYLQITGVCLNVGDSAIAFPHESYGETLAKCKRYFERIGIPAGSSYQSFGVGHVHTNVTAVSVIPYEVEKRANPTASYDTASNFALLNAAGGAVACTGRSTSRISTHAVSITANASGLVVGNATFLLANNTAKPFIDIEAEL
jgi:hypothetical protein